ncbi:MAG TPA: hypothetical protein PKD45_13665 [Flavobacteriales bacterium]|nr:hypothetical protein [Flavobacteriales bacterium]
MKAHPNFLLLIRLIVLLRGLPGRTDPFKLLEPRLTSPLKGRLWITLALLTRPVTLERLAALCGRSTETCQGELDRCPQAVELFPDGRLQITPQAAAQVLAAHDKRRVWRTSRILVHRFRAETAADEEKQIGHPHQLVLALAINDNLRHKDRYQHLLAIMSGLLLGPEAADPACGTVIRLLLRRTRSKSFKGRITGPLLVQLTDAARAHGIVLPDHFRFILLHGMGCSLSAPPPPGPGRAHWLQLLRKSNNRWEELRVLATCAESPQAQPGDRFMLLERAYWLCGELGHGMDRITMLCTLAQVETTHRSRKRGGELFAEAWSLIPCKGEMAGPMRHWVVRAMGECGLFGEALPYAHSVNTAHERIELLCTLLRNRVRWSTEGLDDLPSILAEIRYFLGEPEGALAYREATIDLAETLHALGRNEEALALISDRAFLRGCDPEASGTTERARIGKLLVKLGATDRAWWFVIGPGNGHRAWAVLAEVGEALGKRGDVDGALRMLMAISNPLEAISALGRLYRRSIRRGEPATAGRWLRAAHFQVDWIMPFCPYTRHWHNVAKELLKACFRDRPTNERLIRIEERAIRLTGRYLAERANDFLALQLAEANDMAGVQERLPRLARRQRNTVLLTLASTQALNGQGGQAAITIMQLQLTRKPLNSTPKIEMPHE